MKISIIGLGLMGASLALAAKKRISGVIVNGYARRRETLDAAVTAEISDAVFENIEDSVKDADIVVVCTPVRAIPELVEKFAGSLKPGAIVTDVGSTKQMLTAEIPRLLNGTGAEYLGSHPIAGSEQQGMEAADPDLYEEAAVILTPCEVAEEKTIEKLKIFWELLGATVSVMQPDEHDSILARTSHLPHLAAAALASAVGRDDGKNVGQYCGKGFADSTRIACGGAEIWHDIIETNRTAVSTELAKLKAEIDKLDGLLQSNDFAGIKEYLHHARDCRERLLTKL